MKLKGKSWIFLSVILFVCHSYSQKTFKNPIIRGMNPDPSICKAGDDYYLVTSTFEYFPGLPIYQSKDLVHWKRIGYALARATNNPLMNCEASTGGQYAATIRYHDGTFYVIGTNYGGEGSQGLFYVTATDPAGPWSDPHWTGFWYVDPSLLFVDGKLYYHSPDNNGAFLAATMNEKTGAITSEVKEIAVGLGGSSPEGPHMYKRGEYYYLMSAEGGTGYEHREVIQRSTSPFGPYEPSPVNPVATHMNDHDNPFHAIGHADMIETPDGWWLVCLGVRPVDGKQHLGRETFLAPVTWNAEGWPKVGTDGIVQEEYPLPDLPEHVWPAEPTRDDFDSSALGLVWNFVRNPDSTSWSLSEKPGFLRMYGSAVNFTVKKSPAFICRRQAGFNITATTKVDFTPTAPNEEAGLVIRGNDKNYYSLLITQHDGRRSIKFRRYLKEQEVEAIYKNIDTGAVILKIDATRTEYRFSFREEGKNEEQIGTATTSDLSNEVINGFTGVFLGMYASGNGSVNTNPADFDWFEFVSADEPVTGVRNRDPDRLSTGQSGSFSTADAISFDLSSKSKVTLHLFDILGREAARSLNVQMSAGSHRIPLNSFNVTKGIYFYRLRTGSNSQIKKVIIRR